MLLIGPPSPLQVSYLPMACNNIYHSHVIVRYFIDLLYVRYTLHYWLSISVLEQCNNKYNLTYEYIYMYI